MNDDQYEFFLKCMWYGLFAIFVLMCVLVMVVYAIDTCPKEICQ